jgi:hypothetical protein
MHRPIGRASVALGISVACAGCGASAHLSIGGSPTLNNPDKVVSNALYKSVGERPASVTCPSNIAVKPGKVFRCTLTAADGTKYGTTVTEGSVHGSNVHLSVLVDKQPEK